MADVNAYEGQIAVCEVPFKILWWRPPSLKKWQMQMSQKVKPISYPAVTAIISTMFHRHVP